MIQYEAGLVRRKTERLLADALAGEDVLIACSSPEQLSKLYNALNVQRFRQHHGHPIALHKDVEACTIMVRHKEESKRRRRRKLPKSRTTGVDQKDWAKCIEAAARSAVDESSDDGLPRFEWRKPSKMRDDDVFYFCDADMSGFAVAPDVIPECCPYCFGVDCFARGGEVAPYLAEARKARRRTAKGESVIAPSEDEE